MDLCQWANQTDHTTPITFEPSDKNITCLYENGVKLILDFLPTPFGDRSPNWITRLGTCPVRYVGDDGWLETGDSGETEVSSDALRKELQEKAAKVKGLDVSAHARNFFDCVKSRQPTVANPDVMRNSHIACHAAALSWILQRKLSFDPAKCEFVGDDEANRLRSRPARSGAESLDTSWRAVARKERTCGAIEKAAARHLGRIVCDRPDLGVTGRRPMTRSLWNGDLTRRVISADGRWAA